MKLRIACTRIIAALVLAGTGTAWAGGLSGDDGRFVYGKLGSMGLGAGFGMAINDNVTLRLGIGGGAEYSHDRKLSGIKYDIKNKPAASLEVLADWYPFADSGLRLTGGLMYGNAKGSLAGKKDSAGNFSINDHSYAATAVGELKGAVKYNKFAPYVGVGWESARPGTKGWRFIGDAGVAYLGKGRTSLSASGAAGNAALGQDVAQERRQLASDFKHNGSLIVSIGAAYSF
ncbi:MAG: hypothetical protein HYS20_13660 [Rhodocyclales bacterium]|nr:hypothetical protein [Rhodocyclales bacterium]